MSNLSPGRLKAMQAIAFGKLRLTPAKKEELVGLQVPGKRSFHELTNAEADKVIDALKLLAGQTPMRPQRGERRRVRQQTGLGEVMTLITPAQSAVLAKLTRELIADGITAGYVGGVRERACGQPFPRTSFEAEKAIEALKALHERVQAGWRPQPA